MGKLYKAGKFMFIFALFVGFIYLQAVGMISKFLAGEIVTNKRAEKENIQDPGVIPPATTFCVSDTSSGKAFWKTKLPGVKDRFHGFTSSCNESTVKDTLDCVDDNTYSLNETVHTTFFNLANYFKNGFDTSLMAKEHWLSDVTLTKLGKCHTFKFPHKVNADMMTGAIVFGLFPRRDYKIFFHDPKYFAQASNPLVYPKIWWEKSDLAPKEFLYLYLNVVKHIKLNREEAPCNEDPEYDYMACIKNKNAAVIGCRPGWEKRSDTLKYPVCEKIEDLVKHEERDWVVWNAEKSLVTNFTQCLQPCTFREYSITGEPQKVAIENVFEGDLVNQYWLGYNMATTKVEVFEESLLYPLISFVAEFGGSLGLFLGASFISLWDLVDCLYDRTNKHIY